MLDMVAGIRDTKSGHIAVKESKILFDFVHSQSGSIFPPFFRKEQWGEIGDAHDISVPIFYMQWWLLQLFMSS